MTNVNHEDATAKNAKGAKDELLFRDECYAIQGAVFDVYREMGCGFLEAVYQECLEKEFLSRQLPFEAQKELVLSYKGEQLAQTYKPDFICHGKIIVELKAVKEIAPEHKAQLLNYLKATGLELGLLVNFGAYPKAEIVRLANTNFRDWRNKK
jgi:GxxExxY protein